MKKKSNPYYRTTNYENPVDRGEFCTYYELAESDLSDKEIARELNISEKFASRLKRESQED